MLLFFADIINPWKYNTESCKYQLPLSLAYNSVINKELNTKNKFKKNTRRKKKGNSLCCCHSFTPKLDFKFYSSSTTFVNILFFFPGFAFILALLLFALFIISLRAMILLLLVLFVLALMFLFWWSWRWFYKKLINIKRPVVILFGNSSFNLKVSAGIRVGRKYGEYSLKINKVKKIRN